MTDDGRVRCALCGAWRSPAERVTLKVDSVGFGGRAFQPDVKVPAGSTVCSWHALQDPQRAGHLITAYHLDKRTSGGAGRPDVAAPSGSGPVEQGPSGAPPEDIYP